MKKRHEVEMAALYFMARGEQGHANTSHTDETQTTHVITRHKCTKTKRPWEWITAQLLRQNYLRTGVSRGRITYSPRPLPGFACWQAVVKDCVWMLQLVFLILQLDDEV